MNIRQMLAEIERTRAAHLQALKDNDAAGQLAEARYLAVEPATLKHGEEQSDETREALERARRDASDARARKVFLSREVDRLYAVACEAQAALESKWKAYDWASRKTGWSVEGHDVAKWTEFSSWLKQPMSSRLPAPRFELGQRGLLVEVPMEIDPYALPFSVVAWQWGPRGETTRLVVGFSRSVTDAELAKITAHVLAALPGATVVEEVRGKRRGHLMPGVRPLGSDPSQERDKGLRQDLVDMMNQCASNILVAGGRNQLVDVDAVLEAEPAPVVTLHKAPVHEARKAG